MPARSPVNLLIESPSRKSQFANPMRTLDEATLAYVICTCRQPLRQSVATMQSIALLTYPGLLNGGNQFGEFVPLLIVFRI